MQGIAFWGYMDKGLNSKKVWIEKKFIKLRFLNLAITRDYCWLCCRFLLKIHKLQATFFGRPGAEAHSFGNINVPSSQTLLIRNGVSKNFSFKQRGEDNSLFTKNIITYMHRSNNSFPYTMFERLFAVI